MYINEIYVAAKLANFDLRANVYDLDAAGLNANWVVGQPPKMVNLKMKGGAIAFGAWLVDPEVVEVDGKAVVVYENFNDPQCRLFLHNFPFEVAKKKKKVAARRARARV